MPLLINKVNLKHIYIYYNLSEIHTYHDFILKWGRLLCGPSGGSLWSSAI